MNSNHFRRTFLRFLKDKGIYPFIKNEIIKDYNGNYNSFFEKVSDKYHINDVFNLRSVLSFRWEGTSGDPDEENKSMDFWRGIHREWQVICRENDYFGAI